MKSLLFILLLVCARCCFGQTDKDILGVGEWSKAVTDRDHTLRGRLVVYGARADSAANHARIYLELQHVFRGGWANAIEIEYDLGSGNHALHFALHDRRGHVIVRSTGDATRTAAPYPYIVTLPCDSTVRLRADAYTYEVETRPKGLAISVEEGLWIVPPHQKSVFLSGTFTPPKESPSSLDYHHWQGTLALPDVKIPVR